MKQQMNGDYTKTMKMNEILLKTLPIANFVQALEIKMTINNKGRGLFTTRFVK